VMMVWQAADRNEWEVEIRRSLAPAPALPQDAPDPFSLADPGTVESILDAAGFVEVAFAGVDDPVYYGRDTDSAMAFVLSLWSTRYMLQRMDPASAARARNRLREALAAHQTGRGVWFGSRAWIVSARRR
jgi:hypothetical protein